MNNINIGLIGHVSHGKTTIIKALSNISTLRHSSEIKKNSTINLGYANTSIHNKEISFIDCPGHEAYIHNMLNGTLLMDCAFLVIDATDNIVLQTQAIEHLTIVLAMGIKNIIILQNKIDLIPQNDAEKNCKKIITQISNLFNISPMIYPISAQFNIGTNEITTFISQLPENPSNDECITILPIIRSFDINKPKTNIEQLKGGVIGGGCISGQLKQNMEVLIIPGLISNNIATPFSTNINKIQSENQEILTSKSNNLIGLETDIDPYFTKNNGLVGQFVYYGNRENLTIYESIDCEIKSLKRVSKKILKNIENIKIHYINQLYNAKITSYENKILSLHLEKPIFILKQIPIAIFTPINEKFKLSFIGNVINGKLIKINTSYNFPNITKLKCKSNNQQETTFNKSFYKELLKKYHKNIKTQSNKFSLKLPQINYYNNKTNWINFNIIIDDICNKTLNKKEVIDVVMRKSLRINMGNFVEMEDNLQFDGKIGLDKFTSFLKIFRSQYLECKTCKSYNTHIHKKILICSNCNKETFLV